MAEQPQLIPDILDRLPALQQAGIDQSARMVGLALQSYLSWYGFNPERLTTRTTRRTRTPSRRGIRSRVL
jgi:hypothetical protein